MSHPAETFRALHRPGDPLVMINVWDAGSARMMQAMGAQALATSSAAHAFTLGRPDGGTVTRDEALAHAQDILRATTLPVQGDFENGFGDDPDTCAETVRLAAEVGLSGICIEDIRFPDQVPYDADLARERIAAAASAARALGHDFVLTARADGMMTGHYDLDEAIRRLQAFASAGADCLYAPFPPDIAGMARITQAVSTPVNMLAAGRFAKTTRAEFAAAGIARISIGSAMARVTHAAMLRVGRAMIDAGDFAGLTDAAPGAEIDALLE